MKFKTHEIALALALLLTLFATTLWAGAIENEQQALADKLLRLHVIPHSNSRQDQDIKLAVRDQVFSAASDWVRGTPDSQSAEQIILSRQDELRAIAQQIIDSRGVNHGVTVNVSISNFPTREYNGFRLPAGRYRALRVTIGDGRGQNWWCVVFPPLCVSAATWTESAQEAGLTDGEVRLITDSDNQFVYRFRTLEWLHTVRGWFR
ncbi:MAG: stage II sporulation protein R [Oscillospiraceae bacterium]|nr:stage II sporulation protein R [Oscillospiraceae bacterium]